jgi:signal transduction histidine kinase
MQLCEPERFARRLRNRGPSKTPRNGVVMNRIRRPPLWIRAVTLMRFIRGGGSRFHLLRSFALLSLISIAATTIVSATLVGRFVTDHLLARDAAITMHFIQSVADIEELAAELDRPRALQSVEGFGEFFLHVGNMPDVVGAVVYSPDHTVLWSSDSQLTGKRFEENHELDEAFTGELVFEYVGRRSTEKKEHTEILKDIEEFVELYLPIRNGPRTKVIAVAEIYKIPRVLLDALEEGRRLVWVIALGGGVFLWTVLYWIVRRAADLIRYQQQQLLESERYAAVGEMASAVAHGIRNPLASIRSSAELAVDSDSFDLTRESAADIIAEADRLEQWVRDLLVGSRLEDTGFDRVRLDVLAREHLADLARRMSRQEVSLELDLESVQPIRGDAPLLRQMLDSLISNALEAMPDGGTLTVRTRMTRANRTAELVISDTGSGIPPAIADQVFSPLVTGKRNGLGLGLALVKRIVERHDGEISLRSEKSQGTTAVLQFPTVSS